MKSVLFLTFAVFYLKTDLWAQVAVTKLKQAYHRFENDPQLRAAVSSLYVIDASTGKVVFDRNSRTGLAPASTQKIITSAAAFEILGRDYSYTTTFGYYGTIEDSVLRGSIYIRPSGDPTFGSWRYKNTGEGVITERLMYAIRSMGINRYNSIVVDATGWEGETIPGGWIWEDIGNYYGAGAEILNWRENQFDLFLQSGNNVGDPVRIVGTKPVLYSYALVSLARAAAKGTGDNAYIYFPVNGSQAIVRGTIPAGESKFTISGAMPSGRMQFISTLSDSLSNAGIQRLLTPISVDSNRNKIPLSEIQTIHTEQSPPLDSISYWFLKRSINLYGESLTKSIAAKNEKPATTANGTLLIKDHWKNKKIGIEAVELNLHDGSGLSPLNRVTTHAQVAILHYAKKQPWFNSFYSGFPEFNNMKMKSGTINGVKGFCGYHTSKAGKQYIFSFIVNNYNGSASALVEKMFKVLDALK